ncbi:hypothetical protein TYRP_017519 [Tyrophagus putrescentiae]|nr:hypothetical protein TYRP_017519 [Tyrophagus putrescentiae]
MTGRYFHPSHLMKQQNEFAFFNIFTKIPSKKNNHHHYYHQVTGRGGGPQADWSNRDACLAMIGLEPTEEFLALSAFTTEQDAILEKFISIGLNYKGEQQQPPARMEPLIEEGEDDYDARDEVEGNDDDEDNGAKVIDLFAYNQVLADIEDDEVEQPRYNLRGLTRRLRRNTSSSSSSSSD